MTLFDESAITDLSAASAAPGITHEILRPDAAVIASFVDSLFRYADDGSYVSLRGFADNRDDPPFRIRAVPFGASTAEQATQIAAECANNAEPTVFCPPIATFSSRKKAREADLQNGLALSVECDAQPTHARAYLENLLGPATVVVASGGEWPDPATGEMQPKVHLHWRLNEPTRDPVDHKRLKHARTLAAYLVGGDASNKPIVHPIRWPGSWHRKAAPKMATIESLTEGEIDLATALERLEDAAAAAGKLSQVAAGKDAAKSEGEDRTTAELVRAILTAEDYHAPLVALAMRYLLGGMADAQAVLTLQGIMSTVPEEIRGFKDGVNDPSRWQARYNDIARSVRTARGKLGDPETSEADATSPTIRVIAGELHQNATQAEAAIMASALPIFQRGNNIVRPITQEVPAARGRMTVSAALHDIGAHALVDTLSRCSKWKKYDGRAKDWRTTNPSREVIDVLLSRAGMWKLPKVIGVVTSPTLRPDGSILSAPGYDAETRLFHAADQSLTLDTAVFNPSRAAAVAALAVLESLLTEFPFVDSTTPGVSKAVALSGLITPVVRGAMSVAPLHAFRANTPGTGKSYLMDTASAICTGRPCPVASVTKDDAETEKRLVGLLLAAFPIFSLDNVNGELGGDLLCQAIERPLIRLRRLGASDIIEIESRATLFATGNGLRVRGDMNRRTVCCDLDAKIERPELREFKGDPVAAVMGDRGRYVSACLTIVRAYLVAGTPGLLPAIASFEDWSGLVRSALVWLGCADPAASMEAAREDDPELTELREMITLWYESFGTDALTVREIAERSSERHPTHSSDKPDLILPDLRDALLRLAGKNGILDTAKFGSWLSKNAGRIAGGRKIMKAGGAQRGVVRWAVR